MTNKLTKKDFGFIVSKNADYHLKLIRYKDQYYCNSHAGTYDNMVAYLKDFFRYCTDKTHLLSLEKLQTINIGDFDIHLAHDYALQWASSYKHIPLMKFLLKHGADATADNSDTLQIASRTGNEPSVRLLLKHGADPLAYCNGRQDCGNALSWAKQGRHKNIVAILQRHLDRRTLRYWIRLTPITEVISFKKLANIVLYLVVLTACSMYIINQSGNRENYQTTVKIETMETK